MRTRRLICALSCYWLVACGGDDSSGVMPGGGGAQNGGHGGNVGTGTGGSSGASTAGTIQGSGGSGALGAGGTGGGSAGTASTADGGLPNGDASSGRDVAASDATSGAPLRYPPSFGMGDIAAGIAHLNEYRTAIGATPVALDEASSTGCEGHLNYLIAEQMKTGMVNLTHDEPDHANPYYSVANENAGKQSDLSWGGTGQGMGGQSFGAGVDLWINGLYHRRPLLEPGLMKVGAASKNGYNCLNYRATGNTVIQKLAGPTIWPSSGMIDVPRTFAGSEGPCLTNPANPQAGGACAKAGFIPSATFYNWGTFQKSAIDSVTTATLTDDAANTPVQLLTYYADAQADHDPAHGYVSDEIALVPQASLAANKTYRVDIVAVVKGTPTNLSWKFTTGTRTE
jgi:hypothetical protein